MNVQFDPDSIAWVIAWRATEYDRLLDWLDDLLARIEAMRAKWLDYQAQYVLKHDEET